MLNLSIYLKLWNRLKNFCPLTYDIFFLFFIASFCVNMNDKKGNRRRFNKIKSLGFILLRNIRVSFYVDEKNVYSPFKIEPRITPHSVHWRSTHYTRAAPQCGSRGLITKTLLHIQCRIVMSGNVRLDIEKKNDRLIFVKYYSCKN